MSGLRKIPLLKSTNTRWGMRWWPALQRTSPNSFSTEPLRARRASWRSISSKTSPPFDLSVATSITRLHLPANASTPATSSTQKSSRNSVMRCRKSAFQTRRWPFVIRARSTPTRTEKPQMTCQSSLSTTRSRWWKQRAQRQAQPEVDPHP